MAESRRFRGERGQGSTEYVGILAVVVVVIGVVLVAAPSVGQAITCRLETAITSVGSCSTPVAVTYGDDDAADTGSRPAGDTGPGTTLLPDPGGTPFTVPDDATYANAAQDAVPADPDEVEDAVDEIRDALDGGFWGVRGGDLQDALDVIADVDPEVLDAAIAQMSDDELAHWVEEMEDGWLTGGWDADERRTMWEALVSKASKETIERFAEHTDELQPSFDDVGGDDARDDPESVANTSEYGEVEHELFADGVSPTDVSQGALGDCWWIASMMAVAQADPSVIEDAITTNPNGTYTVRLYDDGDPVYVTVTPDMVLGPNGNPAFVGNDVPGDEYELWPMVMEKAMALHYGDFDDIEGGTADVGLSALTGQSSSNTDPGDLSLNDLAAVLDDGGAIGLSSLSADTEGGVPTYAGDVPSSERLRTGHAYYVSEVDVDAGTVTVVNPWGMTGYPPLTLTYDEFVESFRQVRTNEVNP